MSSGLRPLVPLFCRSSTVRSITCAALGLDDSDFAVVKMRLAGKLVVRAHHLTPVGCGSFRRGCHRGPHPQGLGAEVAKRLRASLLATIIGAVSYCAAMTEAPCVHTLMDLRMGRGPALAPLLTGRGISRPNWLAVARTRRQHGRLHSTIAATGAEIMTALPGGAGVSATGSAPAAGSISTS